jgi:hypothetical protein
VSTIDVYLETGSKRTIAGAVEWPGWCRAARDEDSALQSLIDYAERYGRVVRAADLTFNTPADASAFKVVERLKGGSTTDFGAPEAIPSSGKQAFDDVALDRSQALFRAGWRAFDAAVVAARGRTLSTGPRGGGRGLDGIVEHVLGADAGYLSRLARKYKPDPAAEPEQQVAGIREAMLEALEAAARGEIPERGPRGGKLWPARFYLRRALWHLLDHAWEIEDRSASDASCND